jgi:hypothetical protein
VRLSHRDFRPARRSKYVAAPPRKRPTLRILLLVAFGILVYLKFDSFVKSKAMQPFRQPEKLWQSVWNRLHPRPAAPAATLSLDSSATEMRLDCPSASTEACLSSWKAPEDTKGFARALISKAAMAAGAKPEGFSLRLRSEAPESEADSISWSVASLELREGGRIWTVGPGKEAGVYCIHGGACLEKARPSAPLGKFTVVDHGDAPDLWLQSAEGSAVLSPLPGRIMEVTEDSSGRRLKVYHGMNLYCYYGGLAAWKEGPRAGDWLRTGDTLGLIAPVPGRLMIRVEKDGMTADAMAFLDLGQR